MLASLWTLKLQVLIFSGQYEEDFENYLLGDDDEETTELRKDFTRRKKGLK